jgi:RHS repeat-associated protein
MTSGSTTTSYLYDRVNPMQEIVSASPTANLLTGLGVDQIFTRTTSAGTFGFLGDALGSTVALTSSSGAIVTNYTYGPYGATTTSGAANSNPYQFTARENDSTGLYYLRARYVNPTWGRFIAEDPIGFGGDDYNLYRYVENSPITYLDPLGLDIRISLYYGAGGLGHIGIGINSPSTYGFYADPGYSNFDIVLGTVPGSLEPDNSSQPIESYVIPTTPYQDQQVQNYLDKEMRNHGRYNLIFSNCATAVRNALAAGGISTPNTVWPRVLFNSLRPHDIVSPSYNDAYPIGP